MSESPLSSGTAAMVIALLIGVVIVGMAVADDGVTPEDTDEFEDWCEDRGGQLTIVNAVWSGGLHCTELEGGESVRIDDWRHQHGGGA